MGVSGAELSPDGNALLFSADVFPDCGADDACNALNDSTTSKGPIQAYMADGLLYRHWTGWKRGKATHTLRFDIAAGTYTDLTPGTMDWPAWEQGGVGYVWSPDGREACLISNHDADPVESTNADLGWFRQPAAARRTLQPTIRDTTVTRSTRPMENTSPIKSRRLPATRADLFRIALYDRATGEKAIISDAFDNWVNDIRWAPTRSASSRPRPGACRSMSSRSGRKNPKGDRREDVMDAFNISSDGSTIVFSRRSVGPAELWRCSSSGKKLKRLTTINKSVADEVDIRPAEEMWISSPTGKKIHTFIVKPHNFDPKKKYPLIINVRGGPQSQWADAFRGDWQVYPGSGYIVAMPNPNGSIGYGQEFTAAISKDWNGKVYQDVMAVADSLEKSPGSIRTGWARWLRRTAAAMMWLEGHTTRFKAIASMMGGQPHGDARATEELWFPQWTWAGRPGPPSCTRRCRRTTPSRISRHPAW